jgi:hypothetical protein
MTGQLPQDNQPTAHQQPLQLNQMHRYNDNGGAAQQQHLTPTQPALHYAQPSPNMSPKIMSSPQHTPSPPSDPQQNPDQAQVLQPSPPRPLFQRQAGLTNNPVVVLDPEILQQGQQQYGAIQNHTMQPQHTQQTISNQQPTSIIQTPILSSNDTPTKLSQPATAIKKGRFRVVKGQAVPESIDNHSAPVPSTDTNNDSIEINSPHVVSTVKRGRFVVKKATGPAAAAATNNTVADASCSDAGKIGKDSNSATATKGAGYASDTSLTPTKQTACTKQKGRFLVKTGGSSASLQALSSTAQQNAMGASAVDNVIGTAGNVSTDQSDGDRSNEIASSEGVDSTSGLPALATKKKGRFVVKTGGANVIHPSPELNEIVPAQEGIQNVTTGGVHVVSFTNQNQIAGNGPVPTVEVPTTSFVSATGQVIDASVPFTPAFSQQPLPHNQAPQIHIQSQLQSQQQSEPSQPPSNSADASSQLPPPAPRRAIKENRANEYTSAGYTEIIPRSNRPVASTGSNGFGGSRGKSGHMIGSLGGAGKLLHYLDTLRSEVVEADRSISSLQSDKRFLVSR